MKRSFMEYDPEGLAQAGAEAKMPTTGNSFAMKFLFSEAEMRAIGQQGAEIQQMSGATLATTGEYYPATYFQELNIAGPNTEAVLSAAIYVLAHIVQVEGAVTNGEENVPHGEGRLRTVVPTKAAAAVIGKGGANIAQIRAITQLHVHVEKTAVPPDGGLQSEQIVSLSGPLAGLQDGLAMILEHVHACVVEPWFASWASSTNVGLEFTGIALELSGKGMRGGKGEALLGSPFGGKDFGGKGAGMSAFGGGQSLGVSGEVCKFFAQAGWCKFGDTCRHMHSGGPAVPINQPPPGGHMHSGGSLNGAGEVCGFFAKAGWCKFGAACRYAHTGGTGVGGSQPSAQAILDALGLGGGKGDASSQGLGGQQAAEQAAAQQAALSMTGAHAGSSGNICRFFASGLCNFGSSCRNLHIAGAEPNKPNPSGEVCRFFQKSGWCQWGDNCHHAHVGGPPGGPTGGPVMTANGEVCAFFLRTGQCKFGAACRYSHEVPNSTATLSASALAAASGFTGGGFSSTDGQYGVSGDLAQENLDQLCNQYLE